MPSEVSSRSMTASPASGVKNEGQPQFDSNLASLRNSSAPQPRQRYTPSVLVSLYSPVKGRSVPACRRTWYSAGVRRRRHSASSRVKSGWGVWLSVGLLMPAGYAAAAAGAIRSWRLGSERRHRSTTRTVANSSSQPRVGCANSSSRP